MLLLPGDEPGNASWQRRQIAVMAGRIGILAHPSSRSPKREWIEIDLQGQVSGRWPVPFPVDRVAATPNGAVYLESGENATRILAKLNRATATWEKLERAPAGILCGVEAGALVFADWIRGQLRLRWYPELN
jgi:hypothetical protein